MDGTKRGNGGVTVATFGRSRPAIDIEQLLVWAYRDECVDRAAGGRVGPSTSMTASIYNMGALGTRVSGGGASGTTLPEDALRVEAAVDRLPMEQRLPVVRHASAGTRPDWMIRPSSGLVLVDEAGEPLPQRKQDRRKPTMIWSPNGNAIACRVRFAGTTIDEAREMWLDWMVWHAALSSLHLVLQERLKGWQLSPFRLPQMPWRDHPEVPRGFAASVFLTKRKNLDTLLER